MCKQRLAVRRLRQDIRDPLTAVTITVGVDQTCERGPEIRIHRGPDTRGDRLRLGDHIDDVVRTCPAFLSIAHIDRRQSQCRGFHDAARRVANQNAGALQQSPVKPGRQVDE